MTVHFPKLKKLDSEVGGPYIVLVTMQKHTVHVSLVSSDGSEVWNAVRLWQNKFLMKLLCRLRGKKTLFFCAFSFL